MKAYVDNTEGIVTCIIYDDAADEYTKSVMFAVDLPEGLQAADENGYPNYKMIDGRLVELTDAEKQPEPVNMEKSQLDILQETVDVLVLSMLGGDGNV